MQSIRSWFSAVVVAALLGSMLAPVSAVQARGAFAHGTVVALQGTPHLWFADAQGVLHWGGDTRALAGRYTNWNNRVEVSLEQLRTLQRGDPWLSAGLLKDGDPIYLVKWETEWAEPRLFHIQSIRDVELFGIDTGNYGAFVLERPAWSARFGFSVSRSSACHTRGGHVVVACAAPHPQSRGRIRRPRKARRHCFLAHPAMLTTTMAITTMTITTTLIPTPLLRRPRRPATRRPRTPRRRPTTPTPTPTLTPTPTTLTTIVTKRGVDGGRSSVKRE